jgi:hypothetical protein
LTIVITDEYLFKKFADIIPELLKISYKSK